MTKQGTSGFAPATTEQEAPIPFKQFLENVHLSVEKQVSGLWTTDNVPSLAIGSKLSAYLVRPDLRLHCQRCDGERTFRDESESQPSLSARAPDSQLESRGFLGGGRIHFRKEVIRDAEAVLA